MTKIGILTALLLRSCTGEDGLDDFLDFWICWSIILHDKSSFLERLLLTCHTRTYATPCEVVDAYWSRTKIWDSRRWEPYSEHMRRSISPASSLIVGILREREGVVVVDIFVDLVGSCITIASWARHCRKWRDNLGGKWRHFLHTSCRFSLWLTRISLTCSKSDNIHSCRPCHTDIWVGFPILGTYRRILHRTDLWSYLSCDRWAYRIEVSRNLEKILE